MKEKIIEIILSELQTECDYPNDTLDAGIELWEKNKDVFNEFYKRVAEKSAIEILAALNIPDNG